MLPLSSRNNIFSRACLTAIVLFLVPGFYTSFQAVEQGADALPELVAALDDENLRVRQAAAQALVAVGPPATEALRGALGNAAAPVRHLAMLGLWEMNALRLEDLSELIEDANEGVRWEAVRVVRRMEPDDGTQALLDVAVRDNSPAVRDLASTALWQDQFVLDRTSLREDAADRVIEVTGSFPLPNDGWKFKLDPDVRGHTLSWHAKDFDDSGWDAIGIEKAWGDYGYGGYVGVGWYRITVDFPERVECDGVEIHFDAIDETGWVWINGEYVGFDAAAQWNVPFELDITPHVKWGAPNQITVRAMNTAFAGGIYKPVSIRFLTLR